jgi:hypothetical protein
MAIIETLMIILDKTFMGKSTLHTFGQLFVLIFVLFYHDRAFVLFSLLNDLFFVQANLAKNVNSYNPPMDFQFLNF